MLKVKFWGVRGSVPSPLTAADLNQKMSSLFEEFVEGKYTDWEDFLKQQPFWKKATYGGNTSCVEVLCDDTRIVLDMGTGLRPLGKSLIPEMLTNKGLNITFLLSHIHWDHIQGIPFFGPLYVNKEMGIANHWHFFGGTKYMETAEMALSGQMDPPNFPVSWKEISEISDLSTNHVYDCKNFVVGPDIYIKTRKLNHPQETYGWRIKYKNIIIAYTTDNEPFDPRRSDPRLVELAKDADLWITDCQYTHDIYHGADGSSTKYGWGHSYPEAVAATAAEARVKKTILFHHDPAASDQDIALIEYLTQIQMRMYAWKSEVQAAYEGLEIVFE